MVGSGLNHSGSTALVLALLDSVYDVDEIIEVGVKRFT
jgi:hypothetical protein